MSAHWPNPTSPVDPGDLFCLGRTNGPPLRFRGQRLATIGAKVPDGGIAIELWVCATGGFIVAVSHKTEEGERRFASPCAGPSELADHLEAGPPWRQDTEAPTKSGSARARQPVAVVRALGHRIGLAGAEQAYRELVAEVLYALTRRA